MQRRYGWKPDLPDHRDFKFSRITAPLVALPPLVDLRAQCPPIQDQGNLGSCTAHAWAGAISCCENIHKCAPWDPSRLFIYYNERVIADDPVGQDSGAQLRDGAKALAQYGCCPENEWPYIEQQFARKPAKKCFSDGAQRKIQNYERIEQNLLDMKSCLAAGFPFVMGFSVYESFESNTVAQTGIVPMPATEEQILGGHAVLVVGYDDSKQLFLVRNSWGTGWGHKGYFQMPYAYLINSDLSSDFWTLRSGMMI